METNFNYITNELFYFSKARGVFVLSYVLTKIKHFEFFKIEKYKKMEIISKTLIVR
jgi:hypothetical protein